ncbi:MAG: hypothetical protein V4662_04510 [Verrucomicrobiota bacterium]
MASQLIYTSAPRLLEAGRTGFGTVARHRAVSGLLVAAVERVSQFARLPGLNPRRVALSHRIIHAGAASYHVFSCIRDAGSDYTGRTNHHAHHLIADAREARAAAEAGLTPADILRQMRWRSTWSDAPRFFEPDEEIPLTNFRRSPATGGWQRLTGDAAHALLPVQAQRCCLLLPGEDGALELFQESLASVGGTAAWLVTFTTHLEPTDDLAELRWVALAANSPLRQQVEGAVRTTFDLTDPQSLPALKVPEARSSTSVAAAHLPRPTAVTAHLAAATSTPASPLPPIFAERKAPQKRSPWPLVVIALICAAVGVALFIFLPKLPSLTSSPSAHPAVDAISTARAVDDLWQKNRLTLAVTRNWLKAQGSPALLDSHAKALKQLSLAMREPLRPIDIPRPETTQDEFMDMLQHFTDWQRELQRAMRDTTWSQSDPQHILTTAHGTEATLEEHWRKFSTAFSVRPEVPDMLRAEIHQQVLKTLGHPAPPQGDAEDWLELLDTTRTGSSAAWTSHWRTISRPSGTSTAADRAALELATKSPDAPVWFRQLTQKRLDAAPATAQAPTAPAPSMPTTEPAPAKPDEPVQAADGASATHLRHIVIETPSMPLAKAIDALPALPMEADMQILIGPASTAEAALSRWKQLGAPGVYRRSFNDSNTLEFRQHRLAKLPSDTAATRIIARNNSGTKVLFEIIAFPAAAPLVDAWPPSAEFSFRDRMEGARTLLDATASRWLQTIVISGGAMLRLQHVEDPTKRFVLRNEGNHVLVEAETGASPSDNGASHGKMAELDREIESVRQGIRIDDQHRAEIETGNLAKQQKEDALRRLEESLTTRQQRLLQLEENRRGASPDAPAFLGLPSGYYSLSIGKRRLCEIKIQSGQ